MTNTDKAYAERVCQEIQNRGWSRSQCARRADLNQTVMLEICNGTRRAGPTSRQRLASLFGWNEADDARS